MRARDAFDNLDVKKEKTVTSYGCAIYNSKKRWCCFDRVTVDTYLTTFARRSWRLRGRRTRRTRRDDVPLSAARATLWLGRPRADTDRPRRLQVHRHRRRRRRRRRHRRRRRNRGARDPTRFYGGVWPATVFGHAHRRHARHVTCQWVPPRTTTAVPAHTLCRSATPKFWAKRRPRRRCFRLRKR